VVRALAGLRERLEEEGGSLTVSRGPVEVMEGVGPWGTPGPELSLMRGLKAEFDPSGILAPGRFGV
jgi:FAD/FMN-containing dehydrogenase